MATLPDEVVALLTDEDRLWVHANMMLAGEPIPVEQCFPNGIDPSWTSVTCIHGVYTDLGRVHL